MSQHKLLPAQLVDHINLLKNEVKQNNITLDEFATKAKSYLDTHPPSITPPLGFEVTQHMVNIVENLKSVSDRKVQENMFMSFDEQTRRYFFSIEEETLNKRTKKFCQDGLNRFVLFEKINRGCVTVPKTHLQIIEKNFQDQKQTLKQDILKYLNRRKMIFYNTLTMEGK